MTKNTILFDFDFTLADSSQGIFQSINYALSNMKYVEHDFATIKYTIGHSLPETFRMLTGNGSDEEANQFVKLFVKKADEVMNSHTKVYPEVFDLMPKLKEKGFKTGIISTKYRYRIEGVLEKEKLQIYFDTIVGGEDVLRHKPDPEGLLLAMEKLEVNNDLAWYIGDSLVDSKAAKQANIDFIAVLTGTVSRKAFEKEKYYRIISNLNDLLHLV